MIRCLIAFAALTAPCLGQSIVTSSGGRSIVMSGRSAVAAVSEPVKQRSSELDDLRMEIDFLRSTLDAATAPKPTPPVVTPPTVQKQNGNYVVAFTASWCGPCRTWKSTELPKLKAAGVAVTIVDVDEQPQWGVRSLPTFWVVDLATRQPLQKVVGFTAAVVLQDLVSGKPVERHQPQVRVFTQRNRLPTVNTKWGRIDLETYNRNCNCPMCRGIRALQSQYRQTSIELPSEKPVPPHQEPTPADMIDRMLSLMDLTPADVLADLGCGDGRILIAAVRQSGCRGVGIEIDPATAEEARQNVADAGLSGRVKIITGDALDFDPPAHGVTALCAYLYQELLAQLAPKFLDSGIRVGVSPFHQIPGLPMTEHDEIFVYRR